MNKNTKISILKRSYTTKKSDNDIFELKKKRSPVAIIAKTKRDTGKKKSNIKSKTISYAIPQKF